MRSNWARIPPGRAKLLAIPVVVAVVAAIAFVAAGGDDAGVESAAPTTSTTKLAGTPTPTSGGGAGDTSSTTVHTVPPATTVASPPAAPWRGAKLSRTDVPAAFLEAWSGAGNRATCALLVPTEAGPELEGATASYEAASGGEGWDIYLRRGGAVVEVLGLFSRENDPRARPYPFSRSWSDGSTARYGPDSPGGAFGEAGDPEATAFEAVLTIPEQGCAYRVYDTLGKSHLEFVLENLRFVAGAP